MCEFGFFFFKQKTAYEMRISDWSSDVCSSDLLDRAGLPSGPAEPALGHAARELGADSIRGFAVRPADPGVPGEQGLQEHRSEERRVGKECVSTCRSRWSPYH